ncbi:putative thioltransferase [Scheffersomyces xylosifermentans]|uniref:putative thioltransferase n=1 Tax=Scheffersomyces xylosifermentans TaxID=1304137 RepID=UPI00315CE197
MSFLYSYVSSFFKGAEPVSPAILDGLHKTINSQKVVVYSKTYCPYCTATKNLLKGSNQEFKLIELDQLQDGAVLQNGLEQITGQRSVPNIFINGKHIGGNSHLQDLNRSGKLSGLLA